MGPTKPTRALIVDDDPVVARSVARRLLREGYTVSLAGSCHTARAAGTSFQCAVLDLDLPDGSGVQLAEELLRQGAARSIVFYTGSLDLEQRERAALFGAVVDKGQDLEEVVLALEPRLSEPPISGMNRSQTEPPVSGMSSRARASGARFARLLPEEGALAGADAEDSSRSSSSRN